MSQIFCFSPTFVLEMFLKNARMCCDQEKSLISYSSLHYNSFYMHQVLVNIVTHSATDGHSPLAVCKPEYTTSSRSPSSLNLVWHEQTELYIWWQILTGDIYKTLVVHWLFTEGLMILNYSFIVRSERGRSYASEVWRKVTVAYWTAGLAVRSAVTWSEAEPWIAGPRVTWISQCHETGFWCLPRAFQIKRMILSQQITGLRWRDPLILLF